MDTHDKHGGTDLVKHDLLYFYGFIVGLCYPVSVGKWERCPCRLLFFVFSEADTDSVRVFCVGCGMWMVCVCVCECLITLNLMS